jgi:protein TonB
MKALIAFIFILLSIKAGAQDTTFFKEEDYDVTLIKDLTDTNKVVEKYYYKSGEISTIETHYSNYSKKEKNGSSKTWYKGGQLKIDANYVNDKLNGRLQTYWDNGQLKREDYYDNGKLIEGKVYNTDGKPAVYYDYEIFPEYTGGINELVRYLSTNIKYPKKARRENVSGKVILKFIVDTDGSIQNITVLNSVSKELDKEAIRVVKKMPKWKPGLFDGKTAKVYYTLPIKFKLTD